MDARSLWDIGIAAIGGASALLIAVGWLVTSLLRHLLDKDIDLYKLELKVKTEAQLKSAEFELKKAFMEHEIRFRRLHEKRSVALVEIYRLIALGIEELEHFLLPTSRLDAQERRLRFTKAAETILLLKSEFLQQKLLFPEPVATTLENFLRLLESAMNRWAKWAILAEEGIVEAGRRAALQDGWRRISEEVPIIK